MWTITILLATITIATTQDCIPSNSRYNWLSAGNIHYTFSKKNIMWGMADRVCRYPLRGMSRVAQIRSRYEWLTLKRTVPPGWYWMDNKYLASFARNIRYLRFDRGTKITIRRNNDENCLVYIYPGYGMTDVYCGVDWARAICEVRC